MDNVLNLVALVRWSKF